MKAPVIEARIDHMIGTLVLLQFCGQVYLLEEAKLNKLIEFQCLSTPVLEASQHETLHLIGNFYKIITLKSTNIPTLVQVRDSVLSISIVTNQSTAR